MRHRTILHIIWAVAALLSAGVVSWIAFHR